MIILLLAIRLRSEHEVDVVSAAARRVPVLVVGVVVTAGYKAALLDTDHVFTL